MSLSLLLGVVIPFALSTAAHGQPLPPVCTNAITGFSQNSACFGNSQEAVNAFLTFYSSASTLSNPFVQLILINSTFQQAFTTFYNNFCASQECVNAYAETAQVCLEAFSQQVNTANIT